MQMTRNVKKPANKTGSGRAKKERPRKAKAAAKSGGSFDVDSRGFYGSYGGQFAPEVLMPALEELADCFISARRDKRFIAELEGMFRTFIGRPTPLVYLENLTRELGGAQLYAKNEGLAHTGAHKINHCVGQALLAKRMNKKRIVAETGAGQHGLATATVCAKLGLECVVYMGARDVARQRPNVFWMEQLGAKVVPVEFGGKRLKDAVNAAMKDWITNVRTSHYLLGSCLGPYPFPEINRFFQAVVGREIKQQIHEAAGRLPDYVVAAVGGGSNALGAFDAFLGEKKVQLIGVEAGGLGPQLGKNAVRFKTGRIGVVEGYKSYWLQTEDGQVADTHSISAGLDYPGVGPLHAHLHDLKRVHYTSATDAETVRAFKLAASCEGLFPALESSHALAEGIKLAKRLPRSKIVVVNLSGRADKDIFILADYLKDKEFSRFLERFVRGDF